MNKLTLNFAEGNYHSIFVWKKPSTQDTCWSKKKYIYLGKMDVLKSDTVTLKSDIWPVKSVMIGFQCKSNSIDLNLNK